MFSQNTVSCRIPRLSDHITVRELTVTAAGFNAATTQTVASYYFSLSDLDNYSLLTGVFDQYRIEAVRFIIRPNQNAIGLFTNSTTSVVPLYCVIDYDNATNLSTAALARSYDTCMIIAPGESACRTFKPRMAVAAYSSTFVSFANEAPQWIDCASPNVQHFGIKLLTPACTAAQTQLQSWIVEREYFVSFKKVSSGQ
jgi:hypothetical protein